MTPDEHDPDLTTVAETKAIQGTASVTERYAHRRPDMFRAADYARIGSDLSRNRRTGVD